MSGSIASGWQPIGALHVIARSRGRARRARSRSSSVTARTRRTPSSTRPASRRPAIRTGARRHRAVPRRRTGRERSGCAPFANWDRRLGALQVATGDPHVDRMVNIWNPYQCMVTFNLSRSASLFESGIGRGMGFRDSNQDLLGFVHMVPDRARDADPRHRRHPASRRRRVPPVPAADQARQRRHRVGVQRRPALADPRAWRPTSRRPATSRSSTSAVPYDNEPGSERAAL